MAFPIHSTVSQVVDSSAGFGTLHIDPTDEVIAGEFGTWRLIYTVGSKGLADGGRLRIRTDSDTDWGTPQFLDPAAADYMSVTAPDGVHCSIQVGGPKSLSVRVHGRSLVEGEKITLTLGDAGAGSPGSRAQTFLEGQHFFITEVDHEGNGKAVRLAESARVTIIGGPPVKLVVVAPSTVVVGQAFRLLVKALDQWGNPSGSFAGKIELSGDGITLPTPTMEFKFAADTPPMQRGVQTLEEVIATTDGVLKVRAKVQSSGLSAISNPILATTSPTEFPLYWADPHGGQLGSCDKIGDYFRYARDVSGIQFVGYQRNADVISEEDWQVQQREERDLHEPGRFIPIPGLEWSGRTPEGGHHNVYFRRHDQPVRRNPPAEAPESVDTATELPHIRDVYHTYRNTDTIITPHVGGEHSNLTWHDPTLEPAMEITSSHGSFEWAIREIIERGYRLGFLGGSDCYTGRPGDDHPGYQLRRYAKSGLTGIYAKDITLDGFFEAMRSRRVYATTGARIILQVQSEGHWIGSQYTTSSLPRLSVNVIGTAPLRSVEIFRGLDCVYSFPMKQEITPNRVRIQWQGASRMSSYSGIVWDGKVRAKDARILRCDSLRFDSPRSHYTLSGQDLTWHAWGCGYPMALVFDVDKEDAGLQMALASQTITGPMFGGHGEAGGPRRISFAPADQFSVSVPLRDLHNGPLELPLGVLDRQLSVSLEHLPGPESVHFEFVDEASKAGNNVYWLRVVQSDLEMAWSSPIYVDFSAKNDL